MQIDIRAILKRPWYTCTIAMNTISRLITFEITFIIRISKISLLYQSSRSEYLASGINCASLIIVSPTQTKHCIHTIIHLTPALLQNPHYLYWIKIHCWTSMSVFTKLCRFFKTVDIAEICTTLKKTYVYSNSNLKTSSSLVNRQEYIRTYILHILSTPWPAVTANIPM